MFVRDTIVLIEVGYTLERAKRVTDKVLQKRALKLVSSSPRTSNRKLYLKNEVLSLVVIK